MDGDEEKLSFGTIWAVGAAALLSSILSLVALLGEKGALRSVGDPGQATGVIAVHLIVTCAIISTLMWAILHFGFVRWVARYRTSTFFLIVWGTTVLTNGALIGAGYWWIKQNVAHSEAEMVRAQAELVTAFDASGAPRDMRVRSPGEAGEIVRLFKNYAAANTRAGNDYLATMHAIGYPAFMRPEQLAADRGLKATLAKVAQAKAAIAIYRGQLAAVDKTFHTDLSKARLGTMLKNDVLRVFGARMAATGGRRVRLLADETAIFAEYGYELDDLSHAHGRWFASGKKMTFTDQRDLEVFNDHVANLRGFALDEEVTKR